MPSAVLPSPHTPSRPVVEANSLVRLFGARRAVDDVSFTVSPGDCLAIFGPNGAGKTTLLRMLAGLLAPTSGHCTVSGIALRQGPSARATVGLVSHASMLYGALTARENVEFAATLYGLHDARDAARRALEAMHVADRAATPVRSLSRGLQQRVSIARAIVHAPSLLLCDEPYTGLDDAGARALTDALAERRAAGAALLVVTHNVAEGLALATHAAIMRAGRFARHDARTVVNATTYSAEYRELVSAGA